MQLSFMASFEDQSLKNEPHPKENMQSQLCKFLRKNLRWIPTYLNGMLIVHIKDSISSTSYNIDELILVLLMVWYLTRISKDLLCLALSHAIASGRRYVEPYKNTHCTYMYNEIVEFSLTISFSHLHY
jgi:hypothetical protein